MLAKERVSVLAEEIHELAHACAAQTREFDKVMDSPLQIHEATSSQSGSSVRVLSPFAHSLGQSMSIKLDANNYILWKSLLLPLVTATILTKSCSEQCHIWIRWIQAPEHQICSSWSGNLKIKCFYGGS
ncbi:hypothetical protein Sjap_025935 [Stephania japonica]|uniref:Uncharacterized protein n=1 Tax=Stephania japonica TaxID=461633 RepID=A0AAP0EAG3_9MAGN